MDLSSISRVAIGDVISPYQVEVPDWVCYVGFFLAAVFFICWLSVVRSQRRARRLHSSATYNTRIGLIRSRDIWWVLPPVILLGL